MSEVPTELRDQIPSFEENTVTAEHTTSEWSALTSVQTAKSAFEVGTIIAVGLCVFWGVELLLRITGTPSYVFPMPTSIVQALVTNFRATYLPALWSTLQVVLIGLALGATVGLVLAALITQKPFVEKIVAPYVLIVASGLILTS